MNSIPNPKILYEDKSILAAEKPSGLLSVPGIGPQKQDCAVSRIQAWSPNARIVHRLDRDTSGILIMAKNRESHRELSRQFHDREVKKTYHALAYGHPCSPKGYINLPIRKDLDNPPCQLIDHSLGRPSITFWEILNKEKKFTKIELKPITGRSHQLRLHLYSIGHPILGDDLYGSSESFKMSNRLMLHANSLTITHPLTLDQITFKSNTPF